MESHVKTATKGLAAKDNQKLSLDDVVVQTDRLILRPITLEYADQVFKEFTPEVTRYMVPRSPSEIHEVYTFINETMRLRKENLELVTVILDSRTGEFLGCCGLHSRKDPKEPEFGIWLKIGSHGHGYGREAIHGLFNWAVSTLAVNAFLYPVDKANKASRKIPESLGGVVVAEMTAATMSGGTLDEVLYRIPVGIS